MPEKTPPNSTSPQFKSLLLQTSEGNFLLLSKLGVEATATLYRGQHVQQRRNVLVGLYPAKKETTSRYQEMGRQVVEFRHSPAVRVYACGENAEGRYLVQEFLESPRLSDVFQRRIRLSVEQVLRIVIELAKILAAAHQAKIFHLRLRPECVWIEGGQRVRLSGFGECCVDGLPSRTAAGGWGRSARFSFFPGKPAADRPQTYRPGLGAISWLLQNQKTVDEG